MDESQFKALCELAKDGTLSQRELSKRMGLSLGKVNYVVNELLKKGMLKAERFKNSKRKIAYMYVLTPGGIVEKTNQMYTFLAKKLEEYHMLKREIEMLKRETKKHT